MKKIKTILMLTAIVSLTISSCKKGDTGPIGPAGTNGTNGNANVHATTSTVYQWEWTLSGNGYEATISDVAITQDIINTGAVEVFMLSSGVWTALPFSINDYEMFYGFSLGQVKLAYTIGTGSTPSAAPNDSQYKVVTIAGTARIANPHVNWKDYSQIKQTFHLAN